MADDPTPDPEPDPTPDPTDDLGDGGKKALDAERVAAKAAQKQVKALETKLAQITEANASEADKALTAAKAEGAAEATSKANERILRAEVKALAAMKLADPADAIHLLDLSDFTVDDNGDVDSKAITKAIDALVADKPYLAAVSGSRVPGVPTGVRTPAQNPDMNAMIRAAAGRG